MAEVVLALRAVGEGFLRMEECRLELSLQMEKERTESEMKRTQTLLEAQQLFVEAFVGKQPQHKKAKLLLGRSRGRGLNITSPLLLSSAQSSVDVYVR